MTGAPEVAAASLTPTNRPAAGTRGGRESHRPQLDGLRAVAVTAVMIWHFGPAPLLVFDLGRFGVLLFFVLSGFLISGILLDARERLDRRGGSPVSVAWRFYIRRFLRIFPIYYATVLAIYGLTRLDRFADWDVLQPVKEQLGWFLTYTWNLRYGLTQEGGGMLSHLWSLCVEEQFYLIWPWIILFAPRRAILPVLLVGAALGFGYRLVGNLSGWPFQKINFMTPGCLDSLALGGLLAFLHRRGESGAAAAQRLIRIGLPAGLALLFLLPRVSHPFAGAFSDVGFAGISLWLVGRGAQGFRGLGGRLLEARPIAYMGKISYGIYVYHVPVKVFLYIPLGFLGLSNEDLGWRPFILMAAAIATAAVSWELFEKPINRLKRHFPYFDGVKESGG